MTFIYVDHAATTPVHPDVVEKMFPYLKDDFGNPSSIHHFGRKTRQMLDEARTKIAKSIQATSNEIVFTSGGTESDNLALMGTARAKQDDGKHVITSAIEHHAVLHTCRYLESIGFDVTYVPVNHNGQISVEDVKNALREDTILVSLMYGNNEVGTLQPIAEVGELLKDHQAVFHSDAVQAYGFIDIDVDQLGVDLLSVSAHKINGPKGVGFLYVKEGLALTPYHHGGEQERKRRAGTENLPGIAGMAEAVKYSLQTMDERDVLYRNFRNVMLQTLTGEGVAYEVNGHFNDYLPHILNVYFPGINVESMLVNLDLAGIAASSGSACTAGSLEPSHVLAAMFGEEDVRGQASIRFSFGYGNTTGQIEEVARETAKIVKRLKGE